MAVGEAVKSEVVSVGLGGGGSVCERRGGRAGDEFYNGEALPARDAGMPTRDQALPPLRRWQHLAPPLPPPLPCVPQRGVTLHHNLVRVRLTRQCQREGRGGAGEGPGPLRFSRLAQGGCRRHPAAASAPCRSVLVLGVVVALGRLGAHLLVVLLQGSQVLAGLCRTEHTGEGEGQVRAALVAARRRHAAISPQPHMAPSPLPENSPSSMPSPTYLQMPKGGETGSKGGQGRQAGSAGSALGRQWRRHHLTAGHSSHLPPHAPPAHQCTKARLAYMRSNLWSRREKTSAMAVELEIMHTARCTLARSPPGTTVGGW